MDSRNGSAAPAAPPGGPQEPEVRARATRRTFTKDYKQRILREADAARPTPGAVGALLRREGLYSSHLVEWRAQLARGGEESLAPKRRGPRPRFSPEEKANQRLARENGRLRKKLALAEAFLDLQKKTLAMLESLAPAEGSGS